jgi:hypothetical protein
VKKQPVRALDDAYQAFVEAGDRLMAELAAHRALSDELEGLMERQVRARNAGACFVLEAACLAQELAAGRPLAQIMAERFAAQKAVLQ